MCWGPCSGLTDALWASPAVRVADPRVCYPTSVAGPRCITGRLLARVLVDLDLSGSGFDGVSSGHRAGGGGGGAGRPFQPLRPLPR